MTNIGTFTCAKNFLWLKLGPDMASIVRNETQCLIKTRSNKQLISTPIPGPDQAQRFFSNQGQLDTAQHWPSIAKNLSRFDCQYPAVAGLITPVCTWRPILAQILVANTCVRYSKRADAVPISGFLTSRMVCGRNSNTWPSNMLSRGQTLSLLLSKLDSIVKVTIGLIQGRYWAKFRLKVGKFKQSKKAAVVGPALDRCKRRHWPNNNSRLLAAEIGPILCRIIASGDQHLRRFKSCVMPF